MSFVSKIFGDANSRYIKSLEPIIEKINELEKDFERLSDSELKDKTSEFKNLLATGYSLDDLLPQAFAAVREAAKRTLGQRHYDVQLIGGIVMHQGKIAEMRTGEGKTLVATLPTYLNALTGKGAHVVSVNDYLVRRDTAWMGQIYDALGLTVGCITHEASYQYDASHVTKDEDKEVIYVGFENFISRALLKNCSSYVILKKNQILKLAKSKNDLNSIKIENLTQNINVVNEINQIIFQKESDTTVKEILGKPLRHTTPLFCQR